MSVLVMMSRVQILYSFHWFFRMIDLVTYRACIGCFQGGVRYSCSEQQMSQGFSVCIYLEFFQWFTIMQMHLFTALDLIGTLQGKISWENVLIIVDEL